MRFSTCLITNLSTIQRVQADENGVEGAKVGSGDQQEEQGQVEETVTGAVAAHLVLQEVAAHLVLQEATMAK